jgi:hypothetical protein
MTLPQCIYGSHRRVTRAILHCASSWVRNFAYNGGWYYWLESAEAYKKHSVSIQKAHKKHAFACKSMLYIVIWFSKHLQDGEKDTCSRVCTHVCMDTLQCIHSCVWSNVYASMHTHIASHINATHALPFISAWLFLIHHFYLHSHFGPPF